MSLIKLLQDNVEDFQTHIKLTYDFFAYDFSVFGRQKGSKSKYDIIVKAQCCMFALQILENLFNSREYDLIIGSGIFHNERMYISLTPHPDWKEEEDQPPFAIDHKFSSDRLLLRFYQSEQEILELINR